MADRGPVKIRQGRIDDLLRLYREAYKRIIVTLENETAAGKIHKLRVMSQVNKILEELGEDAAKWVQAEIPQYYIDGANVAKVDLKRLGIDVERSSGFALINKEAVKALVDETALSFAEGIRGVSRNARRMLDDALKQQLNFTIAEGRLTGEARRVVSAAVKQRLQDEGLTALVDRSGRKWSLDTYSEMLVRTKAVEARNQGLANSMLSYGYDLVQVSNHGSSHKACARWEGKVLSISGKTPTGTKLPGGRIVAGSMADAKAAGLFHPNCQHSANVFTPELAAETHAYDNPYLKMTPAQRAKADQEFINRVR